MVIPGRIEKKLLVADRLFDPSKASQYTLLCQAGLSGMKLAVVDEKTGLCLALGDLRNDLAEASSALPDQVRSFSAFMESAPEVVSWLPLSFGRTVCSWEGPSSTLVPATLLVPGDMWEYLSFGHKVEAGETVMSDQLPDIGAVNVYAVPEKIREMLTRVLGVSRLFHFSTAFLEGALADHLRYPERPVLYVYLTGQSAEVALIGRNGLMIHNRFVCSAPEDVVYYLLYVLQQFAVPSGKATVVLTGRITAADHLFELLGTYIGDPVIPQKIKDIHGGKALENVPAQEWFTLLNLLRCVS